MTTEKEVKALAGVLGIGIATWSPGDGLTRYRFFTQEPYDYWNGNQVFTALRSSQATIWLNGYAHGKEDDPQPNHNTP